MPSYKQLFKFPLKMVITGLSESGKSYLLRNRIIPAIIDDYDAVFIISPTADLDEDWVKLKNKNKKNRENVFLITDFTDETLKETLELCGENRRIGNKDEIPHEEQPKYLFVCDDITDVLSQSKKDFFSQMSIKGRHYNCSYILTSHKWNVVNRMIRNNVKFKIFFNITIVNELESVLDDCSTTKVPKKKLLNMLEDNTGEHEAFMIHNNKREVLYHVIKPNGDIKKLDENKYK